jgi:GABA(A) receptor-associated protein
MSEFRKRFKFEERKEITDKILTKYDDKCPLYLSFDSQLNLKSLKNYNRYIVTSNLTLGQFLLIVKKKINIDATESLTLFIEIYDKNNSKMKDSIIAPLSSSIDSVYNINKNDDGFLYMRLVKENVFG